MPTVQAEFWLNDSLYLKNNHNLHFTSTTETSTSIRLLPEFSCIQQFPTALLPNTQFTLGTQLELQASESTNQSEGIIKELNVTTSLNPYWSFTMGRQKISHIQPGLFTNSLNKNDQSPDPLGDLNYSQGILATFRLGPVEQQLSYIQQTEDNYLITNKNTASYHYKIKTGIPGYKIGPLTLLISHQEQGITRGMIGSALQLPMKFVPGSWQWSFQFASEFNNSEAERNQQAWQNSMVWLGFVPHHNIGILFSHTDKQWIYSDDFNANQSSTAIRYQWLALQSFSVQATASSITKKGTKNDNKNEERMEVKVNFSF